MAENQRTYYVRGIQMLNGLRVDCFGGSLVEDVGTVVPDTGCTHIVEEHTARRPLRTGIATRRQHVNR